MDWTDVQGVGYLCLVALLLMTLVGVAPDLIAFKDWIASFFGGSPSTSYEDWSAQSSYEYNYYDDTPSFVEDLWIGIMAIFSKIWEAFLWIVCAIILFCIITFILWVLYQVSSFASFQRKQLTRDRF